MTVSKHESVLLEESIAALAIKPGGLYIDGTFGRGGHSAKILEALGEKGRLLAFDKDTAAIEWSQQRFAGESRLRLVHASFTDMPKILEEEGLLGKVDGILLDLGVSSPQLDEAERGFSFMRNGPLDMRMNPESGVTAAQWLATAEQKEIRDVLKFYGEEKFAGLIAKRIVERRVEAAFVTTLDLANFITEVVPRFDKGKHAATRSFQAIRIHINRELDDLKDLLSHAVSMLADGGRLVVISFHSLEDRIVKQYLKAEDKGPQIPRHIPIREFDREPHLKITSKAVKAGGDEVSVNVRSRSAVMRIAEKVLA